MTVKGSPVRSLQKFVEADLTPEQRASVFSQLPAEFAARLRSPILATEKIPVHILNRFTEEAAKAKGESLESFARRVGRFGADEAVRGIYRFFALALTPTALLSKGAQMWTALYSRGELRVENQTSTSATIRLVDYPSERAACLRITGWIEKMAEMTGVKVIRIEQTKCFAQGAPACEWEAEWK